MDNIDIGATDPDFTPLVEDAPHRPGTASEPARRITDLETLRESREAVITRSEAARVLRTDVRSVSRAINDGSIPSLRIGSRVLVPREKLLAMLSAEAGAA